MASTISQQTRRTNTRWEKVDSLNKSRRYDHEKSVAKNSIDPQFIMATQGPGPNLPQPPAGQFDPVSSSSSSFHVVRYAPQRITFPSELTVQLRSTRCISIFEGAKFSIVFGDIHYGCEAPPHVTIVRAHEETILLTLSVYVPCLNPGPIDAIFMLLPPPGGFHREGLQSTRIGTLSYVMNPSQHSYVLCIESFGFSLSSHPRGREDS